ncbi:guanyl-specific ribonuclease [Streptomyces sp. NBRC 110611]|nr:guanyl-specific ribonuclease [Streptomyces sp. NBRC 110611]
MRVQGVGKICYSRLPSQAHDTLDLIAKGGPYPYPKDGTVFDNREGILPAHDTGYYHEYTVITPGSPDRGARRIVTGEQEKEDYYTADHYKSFDLVDHGC